MVNWMHGRIKEVARIFHEKFGLCNVTYQTTPSSVIFFCDGYFLAMYEDKMEAMFQRMERNPNSGLYRGE